MRDRAEMDEFVARVRAESDIVAVVSGYVPLKRKGNRYWGCCPFHQEKTPSFSVTPDKGFFYCFGCHAGGNVFKFISLMENISYFEAIKLQAEKAGIPLPTRQKSPQEIERERQIAELGKVHEMAKDFFHNCLTMTRYGEAGKAYLAQRDITPETVEEFQLGFAPNAWEKLADAFQRRGVSKELLLKSGLVLQREGAATVYDRFRNRVMIPIMDERGRVVAFGGRVLDNSTPKYLNSPETLIFNKRKLLFGLNRAHRAIQQAGYAIVVEGYMDAISVFGAGVKNVVATLGTAFTPDHCKKLLRYAPAIYFCYDSDEAGQSATIRALSVVRSTGAMVKVIVVPDGKDPDEYIRRNGAKAFEALVKQALPLVEYRLRYVLSHTNYENLEGKVKALQEMLPVLTGIRQAAELTEYIMKLSQTLMLDEGVVREELRRYARNPLPEEDIGPARIATRHAVRQPDTALKRAGRIVIRTVWQDPSVLAHVQAMLPENDTGDEAQREVLGFLLKQYEEGIAFDDVAAVQVLSEEAQAELSHSLVESLEGQEAAAAYQDSIAVLRKAYLGRQYMKQSRLAQVSEQAGDFVAAAQALQAAQKIKKEMDDL